MFKAPFATNMFHVNVTDNQCNLTFSHALPGREAIQHSAVELCQSDLIELAALINRLVEEHNIKKKSEKMQS